MRTKTVSAVRGLGLLVLVLLVACSEDSGQTPTLAFPDLRGPQQVTALPGPPLRTPTSRYAQGPDNALALLVLDPAASWLGLVHGLKSVGVPVRVVTDIQQALRHDVVMVYPMLTGSGTSPGVLQQLAGHVRSGNTLLAFSVIGGGMPQLFGFGDSVEHRSRSSLEFTDSPLSQAFIADPNEATVRLSALSVAADAPSGGLPGISYSEPRRPPVARYGDGSTAITHNFFATDDGRTGHAYALGIDFGHYILRAHNGRFVDFAETYVNDYQPMLDTVLRFLVAAYQQGEPDAVVLRPVPDNRDVTVLLTHDVDYTQSLLNTQAYAEAELAQSVPATYFIQTKYVTDYNDALFFEAAQQELIQRLVNLGSEFGSHSVAHSNEFSAMPMGNGREQYPDYRPFVQDFTTVRNASVLGELRVSKFLLEQTTGQQIRAFRPGHLSLPEQLPEALQAAGYDFSSSITANEALTHLPYRLMHSRGYDAETDVYEFPVTVEDEQWALQDSLPQVLALTRRIARHGGIMNLLIHTEATGDKLVFQQQFVAAMADDAHFSSVSDFGDWWAARDALGMELNSPTANSRQLRLQTEQMPAGLTLQLPENWRYESGLNGSRQSGSRLILPSFSGVVVLRFVISEN